LACSKACDTRVGMHDQVQAALEVVEHRQLFGQQQQDVRRAQLIAAGRAARRGSM
jgi:hypothetical protein